MGMILAVVNPQHHSVITLLYRSPLPRFYDQELSIWGSNQPRGILQTRNITMPSSSCQLCSFLEYGCYWVSFAVNRFRYTKKPPELIPKCEPNQSQNFCEIQKSSVFFLYLSTHLCTSCRYELKTNQKSYERGYSY